MGTPNEFSDLALKRGASLFEEPCKLGVVVESPAAAQDSVPNFGVIAAKTSDVRAVGFSEIYVSGRVALSGA